MSHHRVTTKSRFFLTAPQPCPYLTGRVERKLFTKLKGEHAAVINDELSLMGFRRSQSVAYRPACPDCAACLSTRIPVDKFKPSSSQKRVARRNRDLEREARPAWATQPQYDLFQDYLSNRHADGGMADMDVFDFSAMIEETPVRTRMVEYFARDEDGERELVAACLTDLLSDGLSLVYSFFDPAHDRRSLGVNVILDHITMARDASLAYVYLGYWVEGSQKMNYKSRFTPFEVYDNGAWRLIEG
jgi:arginine-tRNA-protein transferase